MRWMATVLAGAAPVLLAGCGRVLSVNPLYTDATSAMEPALAGVWEQDDGSGILVVRDTDKNTYSVVIVPTEQGSDVQAFDVRLVRIGGLLFADCIERRDADIPGHMLALVTLAEDKLQVALPDEDWLKSEKPDFPVPAHNFNDKTLILTAPTVEVERFMVRCAATSSCFGQPGILHRLK